MLRPTHSCPSFKDQLRSEQAGEKNGVQASDAAQSSTSKSRQKSKVQSDFPVPPRSIEVAFDFQSEPQQYDRDGSDDDASDAVLGTGAFGAAYRYVRVMPRQSTEYGSVNSSLTTFACGSQHNHSEVHGYSTPASSMEEHLRDDSTDSARAQCQMSHLSNLIPSQKLDKLINPSLVSEHTPSAPRIELELVDTIAGSRPRHRSGSVLRTAASLPQLKQAAQQSTLQTPEGHGRQGGGQTSFEVIVVKLCRTPITGSFDELPRNPKNALVKPKAGWHIRIVRGESRLLRYLQKAQALQIAHERSQSSTASSTAAHGETGGGGGGQKAGSHDEHTLRGRLSGSRGQKSRTGAPDDPRPPGFANKTHTVRLLADLPANGRSDGQIYSPLPDSAGNTAAGSMANDPLVAVQLLDQHSRPPYRMLAFEELVDLDAEFVDGAWVKGTQPWTSDQVERASRETAMGLRFLHAHAIVHSDLKPANLMKCPLTGAVKIIDLGAARRFVRIEDQFKHSTTIVEERDAAMNSAEEEAAVLKDTYCEGLTSLTGSPHFMAPEILLQAARYIDKDGCSRSTLKDYKRQPHFLPASPSTRWLRLCLDDYAVGWGLKADIWSWACCVLSFLVRMLAPLADRNNTALICPFDFTFDDASDALHPLHELGPGQKNMPHFHLWARIYPLRIQEIVAEGAHITTKAQECMSANLTRMVVAALRHRSLRPTAAQICENLVAHAARPPLRHSPHTVPAPSHSGSSAEAGERLHVAQSDIPSSQGNPELTPNMVKMNLSSPPLDDPSPSSARTSSVSGVDTAALEHDKQALLSMTPRSVPQTDLASDLQDPVAEAEQGEQPFPNRGRRLTRRPVSPCDQDGMKLAGAPMLTDVGATAVPRPRDDVQPAMSFPFTSEMLRADEQDIRTPTALGLQLGKTQFNSTSASAEGGVHSPTMSRFRTRLTSLLSSPAGSSETHQRDLLTPPETPRDAKKKEKPTLARRRMTGVSTLNLRFANMLSAMHTPARRERPGVDGDLSPSSPPVQRQSHGDWASSLRSYASSASIKQQSRPVSRTADSRHSIRSKTSGQSLPPSHEVPPPPVRPLCPGERPSIKSHKEGASPMEQRQSAIGRVSTMLRRRSRSVLGSAKLSTRQEHPEPLPARAQEESPKPGS